jgi:hypothetical protein
MSSVLTNVAEDQVLLTPSNTTVFAKAYAGFIAATAGNVQITNLRNRVVVIPALAGVVYWLPFTVLWSTNTVPTTILGLVAQPYLGGV